MRKRTCEDQELIFKIERIGFGLMALQQFPVDERLYDCAGQLIQQAACSAFHYQQPGIYGKFFGHLPEEKPFKEGQIVCFRNRLGQLILAIVARDGWNIREGYCNYRQALNDWVREGNRPEEWTNTTHFPGSDDDEYFVQFGPYDKRMLNFVFVHTMDIIPVQRSLSDKKTSDLKKWHQDYIDSLEM